MTNEEREGNLLPARVDVHIAEKRLPAAPSMGVWVTPAVTLVAAAIGATVPAYLSLKEARESLAENSERVEKQILANRETVEQQLASANRIADKTLFAQKMDIMVKVADKEFVAAAPAMLSLCSLPADPGDDQRAQRMAFAALEAWGYSCRDQCAGRKDQDALSCFSTCEAVKATVAEPSNASARMCKRLVPPPSPPSADSTEQ